MGSYSSDEERERKKKKGSRRSASRSRSPRHSSKQSKSKHKTKRRGKDSRRRSHSRSRDSSRSKRSRSRDRSSRSSRSRRSRSRSRSYERRRRSYSRSSSSDRDREPSTSSSSKGLADMTPSEQNQARMQLALEKAMAADEAIRLRHGITELDSPLHNKKRQDEIAKIESEGFSQQSFSSNKPVTNKNNKARDSELMFGTSLDYVKVSNKSTGEDEDNPFMHHRLSENPEKRKARWYEHLETLRAQLRHS